MAGLGGGLPASVDSFVAKNQGVIEKVVSAATALGATGIPGVSTISSAVAAIGNWFLSNHSKNTAFQEQWDALHKHLEQLAAILAQAKPDQKSKEIVRHVALTLRYFEEWAGRIKRKEKIEAVTASIERRNAELRNYVAAESLGVGYRTERKIDDLHSLLSPKEQTPGQLYNLGRAAFREGRYYEAERHFVAFRKAVGDAPTYEAEGADGKPRGPSKNNSLDYLRLCFERQREQSFTGPSPPVTLPNPYEDYPPRAPSAHPDRPVRQPAPDITGITSGLATMGITSRAQQPKASGAPSKDSRAAPTSGIATGTTGPSTPVKAGSGSATVYVSASGAKYHLNPQCGNRILHPTTLDKAQRKGPCSFCCPKQ